MPRQSEYTQTMADAICEAIEQGQSLRAIHKMPGMPAPITVLKWLNANPLFAVQYARAREAAADAMAQEIQDIADDPTEDVQRSKLRVDARKWLASKLKPKKYGDTTNLTLSADSELLEAIRELGKR